MGDVKEAEKPAGYAEILLEVSNVRLTGVRLEVQLRADREPDRPRWWSTTEVKPEITAAQFKAITEALEKKRPVVAQLKADGEVLTIAALSIQYAETIR